MKDPFRLMIAVPCMDYLHVEFVKSLTKLTEHMQRERINYRMDILPGTLVYLARDNLACRAINEGFTHLLFIDSDMVFDESIVEDMQFCGKEYVCGAFQSRRKPYGSCIFSSLKPLTKVENYGMEPFRIAGSGMACTMISTRILKEVQCRYGTCFSPETFDGVKFGEDLAFCWRANKLGIEMWCDPTVRIGHVGHIVIWPEDGDRMRGDIQGLDGKKVE